MFFKKATKCDEIFTIDLTLLYISVKSKVKISSIFVAFLKNKNFTDLWKILNCIKLILGDQGNYLDSYTISLESFRSFRGPLFRKPVTGQDFFCCFLQQTGSRIELEYM